MLDLTNRILNTAGLTGGAATERKDCHRGRHSLALNELLDFGEAQSRYFNFFGEAQLGYSDMILYLGNFSEKKTPCNFRRDPKLSRPPISTTLPSSNLCC